MIQGRFHHILHVKSPTIDDAIKLFKYFGNKYNVEHKTIDDLINKYCSTDYCGNIDNNNDDSYDNNNNDITENENEAEEPRLSGADIEGMCKEATMNQIRKIIIK